MLIDPNISAYTRRQDGQIFISFFILKMTSPFFGLKNNQKTPDFNKKKTKEEFAKKSYKKTENQNKSIRVVKKPNLQILISNNHGAAGAPPPVTL